jgi:phenylacetate-coenzyme A ligase PaaK-like adenylate-forming protein
MNMLDLSPHKLQTKAFSTAAAMIANPATFAPLARILEIDLLEHGDPAARNAWVSQQVFNLLSHARVHSKFWAKRLDRGALHDLKRAPVLSRRDLVEQVAAEGCLPLGSEHGRVQGHSTSGSTGIVARFFVSDMNAGYNQVRWLAQFLFERQDLTLNFVMTKRHNVEDRKGYMISESPKWTGPLSGVFRGGTLRTVTFQDPDYSQLGAELLRKPCGYFSSVPSVLLSLASALGEKEFRKLQIVQFRSRGEQIPQALRDLCQKAGIRVSDCYSCEEVGPIGYECTVYSGKFHIATSNVVVECDGPLQDIDGHQVRILLITHLHSYATPFIRYEVGDLGSVASECPCGHRGPIISHLHGRATSFLLRRNGTRTSFVMDGRQSFENVKEWRVRQTALDKLIFEVVPRSELTEDTTAKLINLMSNHSGPEFNVEIKVVDRIDWGAGYKRLAFRCEI